MPAKAVKSVQYTQDDGSKAYALVLSKNPDGSVNLAVLDPDTYTWHAANQAPADRVS